MRNTIDIVHGLPPAEKSTFGFELARETAKAVIKEFSNDYMKSITVLHFWNGKWGSPFRKDELESILKNAIREVIEEKKLKKIKDNQKEEPLTHRPLF